MSRRLALRAGVLAFSTWMGWWLGPALDVPPLVSGVAGLGLGALAVELEVRGGRASIERLAWGAAGALLGLVGGLAAGLALLPVTAPPVLTLTGCLGAYLGTAVALRRQAELAGLLARIFTVPAAPPPPGVVVDTSALVDGRIADVVAAGFLGRSLVVPRMVLDELQRLADAPDATRRARGARGFDMLEKLRAQPAARVEVLDGVPSGGEDVDAALVRLAREGGLALITTDHALARRAGAEGVAALELHALALALRPPVLAGQRLHLHVVREGKEAGQGLAYLDDGTLVVIDQARRFIGQPVEATVTGVLPTAAGRMVFARLGDGEGAAG